MSTSKQVDTNEETSSGNHKKIKIVSITYLISGKS
jgi:hypothetical protein